MSNGSIVINNASGRALRRRVADVTARDVLDCAGDFSAGDTIYITFRAIDGGQYVVATGIAACDANTLRQMAGASSANLILRAQDVKLLWP